jgi:alkylation response protein AidB-like acyl-CoA dehydrogenase
VHTLACYPLAEFGTDEQRDRWLPDLIGGELLGAYCLSEAGSGSDAAALQTRAVRDGDAYVVDGAKAWVTHGGEADFYDLMVRTGAPGAKGISCLLAEASTPGLVPQRPERKMGMRSSTTATIQLESARVPADRLLGEEGGGFRIAMSALDGGRLGIAACAVGWRRRRSTPRWPTPRSAGSSASASPTSRACRSCSPTWPRRWRPPARCTWRRPAGATPASRSGRRPP